MQAFRVCQPNTEFSQHLLRMSSKASFLRPLLKAPILIETWWFLEISLHYRIFAMLIL